MYKDLIQRIKVAPAGSREIDAEIHCLVTGRITHPKMPVGYTMVDCGSLTKNARLAASRYITKDRGPAPRYTSEPYNLTAAESLIPEDETNEITGRWDWQVESTNGGLTIRARVGPAETEMFASEPALAMSGAALKAQLIDRGEIIDV